MQRNREESSNSVVEQLKVKKNGATNANKPTTPKNTDSWSTLLAYAATVNNATVASMDISMHRADDLENVGRQRRKEAAIPTGKNTGNQREAA